MPIQEWRVTLDDVTAINDVGTVLPMASGCHLKVMEDKQRPPSLQAVSLYGTGDIGFRVARKKLLRDGHASACSEPVAMNGVTGFSMEVTGTDETSLNTLRDEVRKAAGPWLHDMTGTVCPACNILIEITGTPADVVKQRILGKMKIALQQIVASAPKQQDEEVKPEFIIAEGKVLPTQKDLFG